MTYHHIDDPDLTVAEIMEAWPETISVFIRHRMLCVGCPIRRFHSIETICRLYGYPSSQFLNELSKAITSKSSLR